LDYSQGERKDQKEELEINFMDLTTTIKEIVNR
jgi:hypothetical protein